MVCKLLQFLNNSIDTEAIWVLLKSILVNCVHPANAVLPISVTDEGKSKDEIWVF
jgi:hypothetical protein